MAQALLDVGRCDRLLGNFKGAEEQYEKALELLEQGEEGLKTENKIMAGILMEQANNHWFQARYQDAFKGRREVYKMALQNNLATGTGEQPQYGQPHLVDPGRSFRSPARVGKSP